MVWYTYDPMANKFFRAGVGTVIYNQEGEVAFFKRAMFPAGIWQFQQGGIDLGEEYTQTLWRELKEEVGLEEVDIETLTELPKWTVYADLNEDSNGRIGQAHKWYFLKLKETAAIDLARATEDEFDDWKWVTMEEAVEATHDRKRHVYETLAEFYQNLA